MARGDINVKIIYGKHSDCQDGIIWMETPIRRDADGSQALLNILVGKKDKSHEIDDERR